jgi:hypothetical protein
MDLKFRPIPKGLLIIMRLVPTKVILARHMIGSEKVRKAQGIRQAMLIL